MFKLLRAGLGTAVITPYFLSVFRHRKTWSAAHTSDNVVLHRIHDRKPGQQGRLKRALKSWMLGGGGGETRENEPVKWN